MRERGGFPTSPSRCFIHAEHCKRRDNLTAFSENTYRMPRNVTISFINSVASLQYQCIVLYCIVLYCFASIFSFLSAFLLALLTSSTLHSEGISIGLGL